MGSSKSPLRQLLADQSRSIPGRTQECGLSREDEGGPFIEARDTQLALLAILRERPVMTIACRQLGIDYRTFSAFRKWHPEFAREVDDAREEGFDQLEAKALEEALSGGFKAHKLLEFLLKGRKRHVYGDRLDVRSSHQHEVVINLIPPGAPGAPGGGELSPGAPRQFDILEAEIVEEGDE